MPRRTSTRVNPEGRTLKDRRGLWSSSPRDVKIIVHTVPRKGVNRICFVERYHFSVRQVFCHKTLYVKSHLTLVIVDFYLFIFS